MKFATFRNKEPKFTADLWTFNESTGPDGSTKRNFSFNRPISFNAVTGNFGKLDVFFSDTESDVRAFCQLMNLNGADGIELMHAGIWQVEMIAPFINIWGRREGFRARLAFYGITGG